jgi:hypothetical protein
MSSEPGPAELLRQQAKAERRLLRAEQRAEGDLLDAQERLASAQVALDKAQARVDRRRKKVSSALELLQAAQAARAVGPNGATDEEPVTVEPTSEPEPVIVQPERDDSVLPPPSANASQVEDDEPSDPRPTRRRKPRAAAGTQPTP